MDESVGSRLEQLAASRRRRRRDRGLRKTSGQLFSGFVETLKVHGETRLPEIRSLTIFLIEEEIYGTLSRRDPVSAS